MTEKLSKFFKIIAIDSCLYYIEPDCGGSILKIDPNRFEINPREFLEYAYSDFELEGNRGLINALTNVKRSIECQSEIIHYSLGIPYENLDFPTKMENLQKWGFSPSVILKHINKIRVALEHFYKIPDPERVDDAIQIAQLFLDVTTLLLSNFWERIIISADEDERTIDTPLKNISVSFSENQFILSSFDEKYQPYEVLITPNDKNDYFLLIGFVIDIEKHWHGNEMTIENNKRIFERFYAKAIIE